MVGTESAGHTLQRPPEGARVVDTGAARFWIDDGIVFNVAYVNGTIEASHLRAGFTVISELSGGVPCPMVGESGPMTSTTREARELLAGPEAAAHITALAVLVTSPVARVVMNFFIRFSSPLYPVRVFSDPAAARAWASTYVGGLPS